MTALTIHPSPDFLGFLRYLSREGWSADQLCDVVADADRYEAEYLEYRVRTELKLSVTVGVLVVPEGDLDERHIEKWCSSNLLYDSGLGSVNEDRLVAVCDPNYETRRLVLEGIEEKTLFALTPKETRVIEGRQVVTYGIDLSE